MSSQERRPFDTSLQGLAALYSKHFLTWLKGPDAIWLEELNSVIVAQQRRTDFLIRFFDGKQEKILHIEFQTLTRQGEPQEDLPVRMAVYAAFVLNRYGQVPEQVLILLKDTPASRRVPAVFEQGGLRVQYQVVRLWELDPTPILTEGLVGLMPLVPLMAGQSLEGLLEQATGVIEVGVKSVQERNEVLTVTGLLASLKDPSVVARFFRERSMMSLLTETPLFQELAREMAEQMAQQMAQELEQKARQAGLQAGREEGRQAGREEGRQEALLETRQADLLRVLTRKFGPVPAELREAIQAIQDAERLEQLLDATIDAPDLDTFHTAAQLSTRR